MDHNRKVVEIPLDDVLPNRFQPRIKFNEESIIELSESIKEHGVIQPIVVRPVGDKYEIIAGERRYKASCMAGLFKIPALITDFNDKDSAEVALIENVQRKDLTPIEEAISYKKILDMGYLTQEKLAEKLGKKQSTVANKLRLLNLDDEVQEAILEDKISERHARSILKLQSPDAQRKILNKIIEERLTVRKTDEEINRMLRELNTEVEQYASAQNGIVQESSNVKNMEPFDFSKLDFLQQNETEQQNSTFEFPKFEDVNAALSNLNSNVSDTDSTPNKIEQGSSNVQNMEPFDFSKLDFLQQNENTPQDSTFEIPKFEDILGNDSTDSIRNVGQNEVNMDLDDKSTPFVFDNLFINGDDDKQEDNVNVDNMDVVEISDSIEFIEDSDDFLNSNLQQDEGQSSDNNVTTRNNTYVANDFKTVINTIRNCAETIEKYGFRVNVEELELSGEYKVNFTIAK